jgi:L-asparagine transporter-like permease
MMIAIFITKFWLGFEMANVTNASSLGNYVLIGAAVSGVVAGVFTGRFITYWRAMSARRVVQTYSRSA